MSDDLLATVKGNLNNHHGCSLNTCVEERDDCLRALVARVEQAEGELRYVEASVPAACDLPRPVAVRVADLLERTKQAEAENARLRHIDRLYDDACQAIPFNLAGPEDEVADVLKRALADLAALRRRHAEAVKRLEAWAQSNDEERQAGKLPTFLNPHTVLSWMGEAKQGLEAEP